MRIKAPIVKCEDASRRSYPKGLRDADRTLLFGLTSERREEVRVRLEAVLAAENVHTIEEMDRLSAKAGVGRSTLFRLRQRWRASGGALESLVPWATRSPTPEKDNTHVATAILAAKRSLTNNIGQSNGAIARQILRDLKVDLSLPTVTRIVHRQRRDMGLDTDMLAAAYGAVLLIDVCGVDVLSHKLSERANFVGCFVVERSSGLILAAELTTPDLVLEAQEDACRQALNWLKARAADRTLLKRQATRIVLTLGPTESSDAERRSKRLKSELQHIEIRASGKWRYGERLRSTIGPRLGRLRLRSSWPTQEGRQSKPQSGLDEQQEEIAVLLRSQVNLHNQAIFERMVQTRFLEEHGRKVGSMTAALNALLKLGMFD